MLKFTDQGVGSVWLAYVQASGSIIVLLASFWWSVEVTSGISFEMLRVPSKLFASKAKLLLSWEVVSSYTALRINSNIETLIMLYVGVFILQDILTCISFLMR